MSIFENFGWNFPSNVDEWINESNIMKEKEENNLWLHYFGANLYSCLHKFLDDSRYTKCVITFNVIFIMALLTWNIWIKRKKNIIWSIANDTFFWFYEMTSCSFSFCRHNNHSQPYCLTNKRRIFMPLMR